MTAQRTLVAGLAAVVLLVAACSASSSSSSPSASAPAASAAAPSASAGIPTFAFPSGLASALASAGVGTVPDASTLVTADMAASVIGGSPTKVSPPINIPSVSVASYSSGSGENLTVFIESVPSGVAAAELQAAIAMAGAQGQLQAVSGIGDTGGKIVNAHDATVAFVKGTLLAVVQATSNTAAGSDLEPKLEAVTQQLAAKL